MGGRGGRIVDDRKSQWYIITGTGNGLRRFRFVISWGEEKCEVKFWSLNVLMLSCELCESLAALGLLHPSVKTGLPSPVLKTDRTDWNILNYCRYICIVSEIYFHSLPLPRDTTSQYLRAQDPLKVYSNANTWENFIAKVNKTIRDDGADL